MSDNFHDLNDEEFEQDQLVIDVDLLKTQMSTVNTNVSNLSSQMAGSTSSGLKSLTESNDADITSIQTKTNLITINESVDLDEYDTISTKVGYLTVTSNKNLDLLANSIVNNSTNISSVMAENIQQGTDIDNIEAKTDFLTIDANTFKYGNLLVGEQSPNQLILQHADINSGNISTTDYSMRVTSNGELRLNVPSGQDYEFRVNNVFQYNNTQIKNLVDNISITQNVDLDTIESDVTGIKNNSLASTLKTAVDANTAKVSSQWTTNGSKIHFDDNVGIKNTNPNTNLEIGDGTSNIQIRMNGPNGQANSSELIFSDGYTTGTPAYYQGATIRFNSQGNRLSFLTDQGNDNTPEEAMAIVRNTSPFVNIFNGLNLVNCSFLPLTNYVYGRRLHLNTSPVQSGDLLDLTTSWTRIRYRNILANNISYPESTGILTVPLTYLYHVTGRIVVRLTTSGSERYAGLRLRNITDSQTMLQSHNHVSYHDSSVFSYSIISIDGVARLETSKNYAFEVTSLNNGTCAIVNNPAYDNSLIIKSVVLENSTTIPSDWGTA
jgi:hypothetical protein